MTVNRFLKMIMSVLFLCLLAGCASGGKIIGSRDYTGVDCDIMYKDCISLCRHYDTSTSTGDSDVNWSGATGDCYMGCETKKKRCVLQNK